ncbi:MAG: zinc-dependent alcohol dehydrogenase [Candidatus Asgardarchaeia archaeon]
MKASGLYGIRDARIIELERPKIKIGEILVKIKAATTCGTDLKMYRRGYPKIPFPIIPWGHEFAGIVEEVGDGVKKFKKGDRIANHNSAPCGYCFYCKKERPELCSNFTEIMGAFAEYVIIPARIVEVNTWKIPENIDFAIASLIEPFSCTVYGAASGNIQLGDNVVIIGAGFQGLSYVQLAKLRGAKKIISIDVNTYRLKIAKELGATDTINPKDVDVREIVFKLTGGMGCDVSFEAAGYPETWELAIDLVRKGGTVIEYGGCKGGTSIKVSTQRLHYDAITIKGVFHTTPKYVEIAWNLITSGLVNLKPMITNKMKLDEIIEAFKILDEGAQKEIKIAIIP